MGLGLFNWVPPCFTLVPMIVPGGVIFWYVVTHVILPPGPAVPIPAPPTPGK
jgi:hypothetical protein